MSLEYLNFEDMCEMMFYGPLAEHKDNDKAKFSYMSLWGGPKALELFHNSALCNQKTSKNLLLVLNPREPTVTLVIHFQKTCSM